MKRYILKRLIQAFIVLIGVTLVTFTLLNIIPGDPASMMLEKKADPATIERIRHELGLDRPLTIQYVDFVKNAVMGDFGTSYFEREEVIVMIKRAFLVTFKIGTYALGFAILFGISVGTIAAVYRGTIIDRLIMLITMVGISSPAFWVAIILQIIFGLKFDLLPISGIDAPGAFILPSIALGTRYAASIARLTRTSMLDAMTQDYVRTARSKGIHEFIVVMKHVFKNASVPIITFTGLTVKFILGGSMLTETVFSIPGLGKLMIDAIMTRDIPVIQGCVVYIAAVFVIINLLIDIFYGVLDPRVRTAKGA
ncbi:ABC transporter permease [Maledivibacter halophilus]|uniref:Peptide/nickel transport system permease protein n=1 Tax=Maledivibacter halophilus TaxID=36842 RepID=A0A1T5MDD5_9FIRM|nr:ABC transporter permease [Maledivibacter halophilus]SKC86165.1 peptide/nickel transport system permease protein [Maledivibacter halophilus]